MIFINLLLQKIGQLLCAIGLHKYKSAGLIGCYPVHQCKRPGCDHAYAEYWGGSRIGIRSKAKSDNKEAE